MKVTIETAAKPWLITDPDRPVLAGIFIDPKGWAVAANGFALVAIRIKIEGAFEEANIPGDFLKEVAARSKKATTYTLDIKKGKVTHEHEGVTTGTSVIEGNFPVWTSLLPADVAEVAQGFTFDIKLLTDTSKAMGARGVQVVQNAAGGPLAPFYLLPVGSYVEEAFAVMMPMNHDAREFVATRDRLKASLASLSGP